MRTSPERGPGSGRHSAGAVAAKIAVSAAALWLLLRGVDAGALGGVLAGARPAPLFAAAAMYLAGQVITAWRWQLIAQAVGFRRPLATMVRYYFIGMFFAAFAPSTLGADVVRSLYLAREGRRWVALNTALFDRICGLAMLVAMVLLAFGLFGTFGLPDAVVLATLALGAVVIVGWWALPTITRAVLPIENRVRRLVDVDLAPFWTDRRLLAKTAAISLVFHVWQVLAAILVGHAVGLEVPWSFYFVFHPLAAVLGALPISLGGIGVREYGYVWFLTTVTAAPTAVATGFALLWLAVLLLSSAIGALVFLVGREPLPPLRAGGIERPAD